MILFLNISLVFVKTILPFMLFDILTTCYDNIECKQFTTLMMMDLKKAFDTVNHQKYNSIIMVYEVQLINYLIHASHIDNNLFLQIIGNLNLK